ncbi:3-oxoacyl-[acyl-carrier-protein] reductase [Bordetella genomosp. 7]|uniref:SDR family oxidoreductase n=1 Tax=Bordetella genomosp. 7 TaxID=1416805 RepID=UPI000B9DF0F5|nr:SDR family oxidoreductase [Bordetella genomosp. 7]OZI21703.1 3-oxoacyl-[acyl-carrier-protein] reductase [Bordetella genomosp. 7]
MQLSDHLTGCRVMISAGASGIGLAIARAFHQQGASVQVCDISSEALEAARSELPGAGLFRADAASEADVEAWFAHALAQLGGLDVLVNNAGIAGPTSALQDLDVAEWDRTMAVNVRSQFLCVRRAVEPLRQSGRATIINISSVAGRLGYPMRTPYAASKWAVIGLTQSLAIELGEHDITVNAILPGIVESERVNQVVGAKARLRGIPDADMRAEVLQHVALHRTVPMADIASTALFLASSPGRSITGQNMNICAGVQTLR